MDFVAKMKFKFQSDSINTPKETLGDIIALIFKFQSDSINTKIAPIPRSESASFKFQSDSINTLTPCELFLFLK